MAKTEKPGSGIFEGAGEDAKKVAKAGPAGVLPVAVIVLALLAILILGVMLLVSRH